MQLSDLKEYILVNTPCYKFKEALKQLEAERRLRVVQAPPERKPGTYPNHMHNEIVVHFDKPLF